MKKTHSIEFDFTISKLMQRALIILLVVASLVFCYGFSASTMAEQQRSLEREAAEAVENIEILISNKENRYAYTSGLKFEFTFNITNKNAKAINYIEGILTIRDTDGNTLSYGTAEFGTTMNTTERGYNFPQNAKQIYTLTWDDYMTDGAVKIWESDYEELEFSFEITKIRIENNNIAYINTNT